MFSLCPSRSALPRAAFVYNGSMPSIERIALLFCAVVCAGPAMAQQSSGGGPGPQATAEHGISLAASGHCLEAIPLLRKSLRQLSNKELEKKAGLVGITCAMTHNQADDALPFL